MGAPWGIVEDSKQCAWLQEGARAALRSAAAMDLPPLRLPPEPEARIARTVYLLCASFLEDTAPPHSWGAAYADNEWSVDAALVPRLRYLSAGTTVLLGSVPSRGDTLHVAYRLMVFRHAARECIIWGPQLGVDDERPPPFPGYSTRPRSMTRHLHGVPHAIIPHILLVCALMARFRYFNPKHLMYMLMLHLEQEPALQEPLFRLCTQWLLAAPEWMDPVETPPWYPRGAPCAVLDGETLCGGRVPCARHPPRPPWASFPTPPEHVLPYHESLGDPLLEEHLHYVAWATHTQCGPPGETRIPPFTPSIASRLSRFPVVEVPPRNAFHATWVITAVIAKSAGVAVCTETIMWPAWRLTKRGLPLPHGLTCLRYYWHAQRAILQRGTPALVPVTVRAGGGHATAFVFAPGGDMFYYDPARRIALSHAPRFHADFTYCAPQGDWDLQSVLEEATGAEYTCALALRLVVLMMITYHYWNPHAVADAIARAVVDSPSLARRLLHYMWHLEITLSEDLSGAMNWGTGRIYRDVEVDYPPKLWIPQGDLCEMYHEGERACDAPDGHQPRARGVFCASPPLEGIPRPGDRVPLHLV